MLFSRPENFELTPGDMCHAAITITTMVDNTFAKTKIQSMLSPLLTLVGATSRGYLVMILRFCRNWFKYFTQIGNGLAFSQPGQFHGKRRQQCSGAPGYHPNGDSESSPESPIALVAELVKSRSIQCCWLHSFSVKSRSDAASHAT